MHSYTPIVLSQPLQSKKVYRKGNALFRVGAATMQGWRVTMEDTHCIDLSLPKHPDSGFFAVYDGHGGTTTSCYLRDHFHLDIDNLSNIHNKADIIRTAIETDTKVMSERNTFRNGSTAVFAIVDQDLKHKGQYNVTIGHIGDSRAILIKGGRKAIALTKDHLPTSKRERTRIFRAGGLVKDGRVRGELAVSRSFGDAALKLPSIFPAEDKMVTPIPELKSITVSSDDLLLLTCDGIFEKDLVFNVDTVTKFITDDLRTNDDVGNTCARLLQATLERGSYDNMSTILIQFKDGSDYDQNNIEYIPGPYYEGARYRDFNRAYILDAKLAGFTLKQARMKYELAEHKNNTEHKKNQINTLQRRNSESEVHLSSKQTLNGSGYESDEEPDQKKIDRSRRKSEHIRGEIVPDHFPITDPPIIEDIKSLKDSSKLKSKSLLDSNDQPIRGKSSDEIHKDRIKRSIESDPFELGYSPKISSKISSLLRILPN
jgi:serine/threonine protein phosphatase PrpC